MKLNILYPNTSVPQIVSLTYGEWPSYCGGVIWRGFYLDTKGVRDISATCGWGKEGPIDTGEKLVNAFVKNSPATIALADNMHGVLGKKFFDMLPDEPVKIGSSTYVIHKDIIHNSNSGSNCFNVMICRSIKK